MDHLGRTRSDNKLVACYYKSSGHQGFTICIPRRVNYIVRGLWVWISYTDDDYDYEVYVILYVYVMHQHDFLSYLLVGNPIACYCAMFSNV